MIEAGVSVEVGIFDDTDYHRTGTIAIQSLPPVDPINPVTPLNLFLSDDGQKTMVLSRLRDGEDRFFLQVSDTP